MPRSERPLNTEISTEASEFIFADTELAPRRAARTLATGYSCNNTCAMCLVEVVRGYKPTMDWDTYRRHVDAFAASDEVDRLVLSGGEASLDPEFLRRVEYARDTGGFRHIRVQTNGRRFSDLEFARAVHAAGVDEFYVSVRGHSDEVETGISGKRRSFAQLVAGLENIRRIDATLVTNTPVFTHNVKYLPEIAELVLQFQPVRVEFYNFILVHPQQLPLLVPIATIEAALQAALDRVAAVPGTEMAATWFPRCILGRHDNAFVPDVPETTIDQDFWRSWPSFHCFFKSTCAWYGPCQGLTQPYIERFGWEVENLRPQYSETAPAANASASHQTSGQDSSAWRGDGVGEVAAHRWLELLSGPDGKPMNRTVLWALEGVSQADRQVRYRFVLPNQNRYELVLEPRDDERRRHAQTTGFNVALVPVGASPRNAAHSLLCALLPIISRNDDGRLRLD